MRVFGVGQAGSEITVHLMDMLKVLWRNRKFLALYGMGACAIERQAHSILSKRIALRGWNSRT